MKLVLKNILKKKDWANLNLLLLLLLMMTSRGSPTSPAFPLMMLELITWTPMAPSCPISIGGGMAGLKPPAPSSQQPGLHSTATPEPGPGESHTNSQLMLLNLFRNKHTLP